MMDDGDAARGLIGCRILIRRLATLLWRKHPVCIRQAAVSATHHWSVFGAAERLSRGEG